MDKIKCVLAYDGSGFSDFKSSRKSVQCKAKLKKH